MEVLLRGHYLLPSPLLERSKGKVKCLLKLVGMDVGKVGIFLVQKKSRFSLISVVNTNSRLRVA